MVLVPEERGGFFSGPEVRVGVVEIIGISVAPAGDCEEVAATEKYQTNVTHQPYTVPAVADCSG